MTNTRRHFCSLLLVATALGCATPAPNHSPTRAQRERSPVVALPAPVATIPAPEVDHSPPEVELTPVHSVGNPAPSPVASPVSRAESRGLGDPRRPASLATTPRMLGAKRALLGRSARGANQDIQRAREPHNTESYDHRTENGFVSARLSPVSTFSIDVDTASYSNVRRFLANGSRPPAGSVRIEELVNYFRYDYPEPAGERPFAVYTEVGPAPWAPDQRLLHIGLQSKKPSPGARVSKNLVFLIDVSGSMADESKLPLLKNSFVKLLDTLNEQDRVALVVYAGASGVVLESTSAGEKARIRGALERLEAGGSTNGASGIEAAYALARGAFIPGGVNRVILATDGDFNVGVTSESELVRLIEQKREQGIFLTVLGFGMGNYKDATLEQIADKGNGNYAYIDSEREAEKVLVQEGGANLITVAKDVKIQIEFNSAWVGAYRLIGYENRRLQAEDFHDDRKDAGELGAGHTVTALYQLLTPEQAEKALSVDPLKYQTPAASRSGSPELATVKLRYKLPGAQKSELLSLSIPNLERAIEQTSPDYRFAAAVAAFGMLLGSSQHAGTASYGDVTRLAQGALARDPGGYRAEFLELVRHANQL